MTGVQTCALPIYAAAIGMLYEGQTEAGLTCIQAIRNRFDGEKRNPFDEPECGHHYARAMASWSAPMAYSKFHYFGPDKALSFTSNPGTYFWSNGAAWGTCKVEAKQATVTVLYGKIGIAVFTLENMGTVKVSNLILSKVDNPTYTFYIK